MNIRWLYLLCCIFIFGCSDNSSPDTNLGTLKGKSTLLGIDGTPSSSHYDGITIRLEGTAFSTQTDINGDWLISKVPAGIYNIIEEKPGFATTIVPEFQFNGSGTAFLVSEKLGQRPDSVPFTEQLSGTSDNLQLIIRGVISGADPLPQLWIMINADSTFSVMGQPTDSWGFLNRFDSVSKARTFSDTIRFKNSGIQIKTGDKFYIRSIARGAEYTEFSEKAAKYDSMTGRAYSPSVLHSVVVP